MSRYKVFNHNNILVNVFIPSYNRAHYLPQAIESVLLQTHQNYHIIIVDDASTDGAADVARQFSKKYPERITAICKKDNSGLCDSLNRALILCKPGEYFAFLADDDIWLSDKLEKQISYLLRDPSIGLVCSDAKIIDANGEPTGQLFSERHGKFREYAQNVPRQLFLRGNFICATSVVVTFDAIASFGFHIPSKVGFTTDYYMWLAISSKYGVRYIEKPLTLYRRSNSSVSNKFRSQLRREAYFLLQEAYARFEGIRRVVSPSEANNHFESLAYRYALDSLRDKSLANYLWFFAKLLQKKANLLTLGRLYRDTKDEIRKQRSAKRAVAIQRVAQTSAREIDKP
jgi:glycosyltransferase involved in cell wall biosynthesis